MILRRNRLNNDGGCLPDRQVPLLGGSRTAGPGVGSGRQQVQNIHNGSVELAESPVGFGRQAGESLAIFAIIPRVRTREAGREDWKHRAGPIAAGTFLTAGSGDAGGAAGVITEHDLLV